MAFRLKLVPTKTNIDFFRVQWLTFGLSIFLMVASIAMALSSVSVMVNALLLKRWRPPV